MLRKVLVVPLLEPYFNPTLVQLELAKSYAADAMLYEFQSHIGAIRIASVTTLRVRASGNFNPTLVQLE